MGTDDVPTYDYDWDWDTDWEDFRYYVEQNGSAPAGTNMVRVTEYEYDDGSDGGDGLLTEVTEHVDSSNSRVTEYGYDWRGRRVWTYQDDGTYGTYSYLTYDRLGRVTKTERYHDDDDDFSSQGPETSSDDNLMARTETSYDDRGRVYETTRYAVDPDDGSVGNSLTDETWYDAAGNVIKTHAGRHRAVLQNLVRRPRPDHRAVRRLRHRRNGVRRRRRRGRGYHLRPNASSTTTRPGRRSS